MLLIYMYMYMYSCAYVAHILHVAYTLVRDIVHAYVQHMHMKYIGVEQM